MTQAYSNPKRENDPYSLPDVEVWQSYHAETLCENCGNCTMPYEWVYSGPKAYCPSCERECDRRYSDDASHFWYWHCFPGCLPDSDPIGPFETEAEAIKDAQSESWQFEDSDDESEE